MKRFVKRRRFGGGDGQNADSLLDTMANVVGILVVLMAVTQLTVNDAMKRIQVWESEEAVDLREEQDSARARLAALGPIDLTRSLELVRLREHIRAVRETDVAAQDTAAVSAQVASRRMQVRKLEKQVAEKRDQLANLKILLDEAEGQAEEEGIELRLPDPRPAPIAANRVIIFCRYGRVFDPRFALLERELNDTMKTAGRSLARYLDAYDVGNEMVRWRVRDDGGRGVAQLEWRHTEIGETLAELRSPSADFRRVLAERDPKAEFLRFVVWEDSFEVYLEARRLAEKRGFAAGWMPIPNGRPLSVVQDRSPPTPVD